MTEPLNTQDLAKQITQGVSDIVIETNEFDIVVKKEALLEVAKFLKNTPAINLDYLANLTAVDYLDYFEVVYHLTSITHNHSVVMKTRCADRNNAKVPSVVEVWMGADFQECEVYDLMGISFTGHPYLRRLFLWQSFEGYPLRKDYL